MNPTYHDTDTGKTYIQVSSIVPRRCTGCAFETIAFCPHVSGLIGGHSLKDFRCSCGDQRKILIEDTPEARAEYLARLLGGSSE